LKCYYVLATFQIRARYFKGGIEYNFPLDLFVFFQKSEIQLILPWAEFVVAYCFPGLKRLVDRSEEVSDRPIRETLPRRPCSAGRGVIPKGVQYKPGMSGSPCSHLFLYLQRERMGAHLKAPRCPVHTKSGLRVSPLLDVGNPRGTAGRTSPLR
jgi:hypothetical protein